MDQEAKDALAAIAKGSTEGGLNWSEEKIKKYVLGFRNKKFAFLEEPTVIEKVKKDYSSGEIQFYQKYIDSNEKRVLLSMGITLRKTSLERRNYMIARIVNKYLGKGLHVAYMSCNEMLIKYIGYLVTRVSSVSELKKRVSYILDNIDHHAIFISSRDEIAETTEKVKAILRAHSPEVFIIDGVGHQLHKARKVFESIKDKFGDYGWSIETTQEREVFLFKKLDEQE